MYLIPNYTLDYNGDGKFSSTARSTQTFNIQHSINFPRNFCCEHVYVWVFSDDENVVACNFYFIN